MTVAFTPISSNSKTGAMPVTYSTGDWCPDSCPLKPYIDATTGKRKSPCYAGNGHTAIHWNKVTAGERGGTWDELCSNVRRLPKGGIWRHNVAGDLPVLGYVPGIMSTIGIGKSIQAAMNEN